jgi:hypothetical protein
VHSMAGGLAFRAHEAATAALRDLEDMARRKLMYTGTLCESGATPSSWSLGPAIPLKYCEKERLPGGSSLLLITCFSR